MNRGITAEVTPRRAISDLRLPRGPGRRKAELLPRLLFLAPGVLLVLAVYAYPLLMLVKSSTEQSLGDRRMFVGLDNFTIVLGDPIFQSAVGHNIVLLAAVPVMVAMAFLFAAFLFDQRRGQLFFQFALFIPYVIAIAVVAITFGNMLTKHGALNTLLDSLGLNFLALDWLGDRRLALVTVGAVIVWRETAFGILLFVSRMRSLPRELFEAARIDGASWWQMHRFVTVPQMRRVIGFYFVTSVITITAWIFAYVFVMTNGGPANATITADLYVYHQAFMISQPNIAASGAVVIFVLTLLALGGSLAAQRLLRSLGRGPA